MRILYFYQYFCTPKGSYSGRAYEFARRWAQAGDQVTIVTTVFDRSELRPRKFVSTENVDGIEVRVIGIRVTNRQRMALRLLSFAAFAVIATWYALVLPADVVLVSSGPLSMGVPGLAARYLRRKPLIFEVRDLWPENAIQNGLLRNALAIAALRAFERLCYRASRTVVALSEGMAEWICERYGTESVRVIPNASDVELAERVPPKSDLPPWAQGKPLVVYAGAMGFTNGCGQLLPIAARLAETGCQAQIVVLGSGCDLPQLREEADRLGLSNLHFLGLVSKEEVFAWLKRARCAVSIFRPLPFFDHCSPNKVYDAFAVGIPVVQETQGWIRRLLEREQCGITVPRGDPRAMADAIARLVEDGELHARMSAAAYRLGRGQFDREALAREYRGILQNVMQSPLPDGRGSVRSRSPARNRDCEGAAFAHSAKNRSAP